MPRTLRCLTACVLSLLALPALAVEPGDRVTPFTLLDQFEQPYTLDAHASVILVARSMATAKVVDAALQQREKGYLEARHVVYVADIERMPAVAKLFAIPSMRSASYRIMLDQSGSVATRLEGDRDTVQWVKLKDGKVDSVQHFSEAAPLREALEAL